MKENISCTDSFSLPAKIKAAVFELREACPDSTKLFIDKENTVYINPSEGTINDLGLSLCISEDEEDDPDRYLSGQLTAESMNELMNKENPHQTYCLSQFEIPPLEYAWRHNKL